MFIGVIAVIVNIKLSNLFRQSDDYDMSMV